MSVYGALQLGASLDAVDGILVMSKAGPTLSTERIPQIQAFLYP